MRSSRAVLAAATLTVIATISWLRAGDLRLKYAKLRQLPSLNIGMYDGYTDHSDASQKLGEHALPKTLQAHEFWKEFSRMLLDANPESVMSTLKSEKTAGWVGFDGVKEGDKLPDLLDIDASAIDGFSKLHEDVVEIAKKIAGRLPLIPGTKGIVTTAGPTAEAILTTSLRMVRKSGSKLPIQIWMYDKSEYDPYMCEVVWPSLDADCMLMTDYLPAEVLSGGDTHLEISHHFQMKILSLLFSTFEQVLFLDCDLFPVNNPDSIFLTEPFISSGWILWPDYWANTNSPDYYKITGGQPVDMYAQQSTESGAMLINKATHASAMILSAYYNRYGPEHYYWLLSQGAIGHGDKDTYMAAIRHLELPVYQVRTTPRRVGYRCDGGERPIASAQHHPYDDWLITAQNVSALHPDRLMLKDIPVPRTLFIHGNLPKNDAVALMDWSIPNDWDDQLFCNHGKGNPHRQWGSKEFTLFHYGYDAEKSMWDQMRWLACEHESGVKRWREGKSVQCTDEAILHYWCPKEKKGEMHQFQKPRPNVCKDFLKLYSQILPGEVYDNTLPTEGLAELPWSSIAGARALTDV